MVAGTMAGMLGIGGGLIIVPVLYFIFFDRGFETTQLMHIALATSLATIITTSISSIVAHQKHNAINWRQVKQLTPSILIGAAVSAWLADLINSDYLKTFFALFLFFVTSQMLTAKTKQIRRPLAYRDVGMAERRDSAGGLADNPKNTPFINTIAGTIIGSISAFVGIGGGTLTVPYLSYMGFSLPKAIATSAACGLPIAVAATVGYVIGGWQQLDGYFLGYIYLPAWFSIAIVSGLFAPLGAKLTHSLPIQTLKKIFAILLIIVAIKMILPTA